MRVKACGAMSELDVQKAERAGVGIVGAIVRPDSTYEFRSPHSHSISVDTACRLARLTPIDMKFVVVARTSDYDEIVEIAESVGPDWIQLGETEDPALASELTARYKAGPYPDIAQVIHVDDNTDPSVIDGFNVRYVHLDSPGPLPGGSGVTHDWEKSREIRDRAKEQGRFVILAGGLTSHNVANAIGVVKPDIVDVESGIRKFDVYNEKLMQDFVDAAL